MFTKLPRWVEIGAFWMSTIAGAVNAIGLLGFEHQAVSHLTGILSLFGLSLVSFRGGESLHLLLVLLAFLLGAMLSGLMIDNVSLRLGRGYSQALLLEALLLIVAMLLLQSGSVVGHYFASAACGLQNGMVSTYSGAVIRTTHVSGLFTDLGTMLGHRLRGQGLDRRKAFLLSLLILGFLCGTAMGAIAFSQLSFAALLIPASMAAFLALLHAMLMGVKKA